MQETIESATHGLIYRPPVATSSALYTTYPNAKTGWAVIVKETGTIWQCEVQSSGTRVWIDTGLREFPVNVATQDDITKLSRETTSNVIKEFEWIDSNYINKNTGSTTKNSSLCTTDFIDVEGVLSLSTKVFVFVNAGVALFDKDKNYIIGYGTDNTNPPTELTLNISVPLNCKYIRFTTTIANKDSFFYQINAFNTDLNNKLQPATTVSLGLTQLSSVISSSETEAATPNAVKKSYDITSQNIEKLQNTILEGEYEDKFTFISSGIGYWQGTVGQPIQVLTNYTYYRYMELKEVVPGQKVVYDGFLKGVAGAFGCADNLGNYLSRVNYIHLQLMQTQIQDIMSLPFLQMFIKSEYILIQEMFLILNLQQLPSEKKKSMLKLIY